MEYGDSVTGPSPAIAEFDATRNMISVQFNTPVESSGKQPAGGIVDYEYNNSIDVSLRDSLQTVKAKIAGYVSTQCLH